MTHTQNRTLRAMSGGSVLNQCWKSSDAEVWKAHLDAYPRRIEALGKEALPDLDRCAVGHVRPPCINVGHLKSFTMCESSPNLRQAIIWVPKSERQACRGRWYRALPDTLGERDPPYITSAELCRIVRRPAYAHHC